MAFRLSSKKENEKNLRFGQIHLKLEYKFLVQTCVYLTRQKLNQFQNGIKKEKRREQPPIAMSKLLILLNELKIDRIAQVL